MHAQTFMSNAWHAQLALEFERHDARTVLARRRHDGPLVVQKPFYPEGEGVCHAIVVHPPAGIVAGDVLEISATAGAGAHALLTTPGAGKWYRSAGPWAKQALSFDVASNASIEWLPQETIVFDGARADLHTSVQLTGDASFFGWEILCLGRTGSGERYTTGECRAHTAIHRDGKLLWWERAHWEGGGSPLSSCAVLNGHSVVGTFVAATTQTSAEALTVCRALRPDAGAGAVTRLPGLYVVRYLGDSSAAAKNYFTQCWRALRPALLARDATEPRIWRT